MKISVEVEITDFKKCSGCFYYECFGPVTERGGCNLFQVGITDYFPCKSCLEARERAKGGI